MGTVIFGCGCSITTDMYQHKVRAVHHCIEHDSLFSDRKSLRQMARELRELNLQKKRPGITGH